MRRLALWLLPMTLCAGPARFARIGDFDGTVLVQLTAADDWQPARRNLPLRESSWLRTEGPSRVEVEFDDGNVLRLGPDSLAELSDYTRLSTGQGISLVSLDHGVAYFTGSAQGKDAVAVALPGAQVNIREKARLRFEARDPWSLIAASDGIARFSSPTAEFDLNAGQIVRLDPAHPSRFILNNDIQPLDTDSAEIGRVYHPRLGIVATPPAFCAALEGLQPPNAISWGAATRAAREDFVVWTSQPPANPGDVQLGEIMLALRQLAPDATFANGAGNFAIWPGRFLRFRRFNQQLGPASGSMGFGVPAAIAAKRADPERVVVAFAGDGDFLMNGQEFATAVQYDLPVVVVVIDNGMYGTIRMHQEREYPGRVSATQLRNPDFAALARAYGGHGETVVKTDEFAPAFTRALASGKPSILHVKIDPEAIAPATTLTGIREAALRRRAG